MRRAPGYLWLLFTATISLVGCNQNPYMPPPQVGGWQPPQASGGQAAGIGATQQVAAMDANNRDLHAQLAQSRQQVQLLRDQVDLLQKQLTETGTRLKDAELARQQSEDKFNTLQASTTRRGGAIITANNSLQQTLRPIQLDGFTVRQEQGTIRIELPVDQMFAPGTAQLVGQAFPLLDRLASELAKNYPEQRIGIEGHTDTSPAADGSSNHQLSAAQAMAVFDHLTRRNRLPANQFFVSAQGANQPLASNGTQVGRSKNRRVEIVVYPETITPN